MIFCISVRLGRQVAKTLDANGSLEDMFWLESRNGSLRFPDVEDAREIEEEMRTSRTQWYRLTRIAYLAG